MIGKNFGSDSNAWKNSFQGLENRFLLLVKWMAAR